MDTDCKAKANGVCTAGYPRVCEYGPCRKNADCGKGSDGTCVLVSVGSFCAKPTVFCRYTEDPCLQDADRKGSAAFGKVCVPKPDLQGTGCQDRLPPPP